MIVFDSGIRDENSAVLAGRLGTDAELRTTTTGRKLMKLRLCTRTHENPEWHSVSYWGEDALEFAPRLLKGMFVRVEGVIRTLSYTRGDEKRYRTEVDAQSIQAVIPDLDVSAWLRAEQWDESEYLERVGGSVAPF